MFCREQAAHYQAKQSDFDAAGVDLAAVGNGTAAMAEEFVQQFGVTFPVFTDPGRRAYDALGMHYRMGMSLGTFKNAFRALKGGHLQGLTKGHAMQQGGVTIVDTEGEIRFNHREGGPGDHLDIDDVLAEARKL